MNTTRTLTQVQLPAFLLGMAPMPSVFIWGAHGIGRSSCSLEGALPRSRFLPVEHRRRIHHQRVAERKAEQRDVRLAGLWPIPRPARNT